jgi:CheY-like chemotaxis protein
VVDSRHGEGSRFWFKLDFLPAPLPVHPPAVAHSVTESCGPPIIRHYAGARRRVLVVDDVPANRQLLCDLLQRQGFEVDQAADGAQALQQVHAQPPDLVLMDIRMPVMDGLEATARLRADPRTRALPVVAVSANASAEDRGRCLQRGANAFLAKPVRLDHLTAVLTEQLALSWVDVTN